MRLEKNNQSIYYVELIVLLAFFTSLGALSIDMQMPAMPLITEHFGLAAGNEQQWIITAYMFGFAGSQLFYGPLSDSFGRKPVLYFGIGLYIIASVACLWVESYLGFLLMRGLQGVGAAAARIMVNAISRDFFQGNQMAKVTSLVMLIFVMVPVFAPVIGSVLLQFYNWPLIFYVFIGFGFLVLLWSMARLPETLADEDKKPFRLSHIKAAFITVVSEPITIAFAAVSGLVFGAFMAYINSAEQIFSNLYNNKAAFPYIFGVIALFFGFAGFLNSKIVMHFGAMKVTYRALQVMISIHIISLSICFYYQGLPPMWLFIAMLCLGNVSIGLVAGNVMAIAMLPLGHVAGMASSVIGTVSMLLASGGGILIAQQLTNTVLPIVIGFFLTSILAFFIVNHFKDSIE